MNYGDKEHERLILAASKHKHKCVTCTRQVKSFVHNLFDYYDIPIPLVFSEGAHKRFNSNNLLKHLRKQHGYRRAAWKVLFRHWSS